MATTTRKICIVVDVSSNLQQTWGTLKRRYLDRLVRVLTKEPGHTAELGLVFFAEHTPFSKNVVKSIPFSRDIDGLLNYCNEIHFINGEPVDTAVSDGLAAAIHMFDTDFDDNSEKYCILLCSKFIKQTCNQEGICEGKDAFQIARILAMKGIFLSVLSPSKNLEIEKLFKESRIPNVKYESIGLNRNFTVLIRGLKKSVMDNRTGMPAMTGYYPSQSPANSHVKTECKNTDSSQRYVLKASLQLRNLKKETGVLCDMKAYAAYCGSKINSEAWPDVIYVEPKLPQFNEKLIQKALDKNPQTLCEWEMSNMTQKNEKKYNLILEKMIQKSLCVITPLQGRQSQSFLVLFPYQLFKHMKPKSLQRDIKNDIVSIILELSVLQEMKSEMMMSS